MPVGFNSPARNFFLLGSSGSTLVSNFFKTLDLSAGNNDGYSVSGVKYNTPDQKIILSGFADNQSNDRIGWLEKRSDAGVQEWGVEIQSSNVDTTLLALEIDANDNLIVAGKSGNAPWIAKYSNGGVIDWQATTFSGDLQYEGITSDANGTYYACGSTTSSPAQAFVEKFDASGNPGWGKSAFMLGRNVVLSKIDNNSRGEVVAVGYLEDDTRIKGYIVKIDTNTGEVLWDRTLQTSKVGYPGIRMCRCYDVYIDSNDQIYVVGTVFSTPDDSSGFIIKYTAEGNIIWQRETPDGDGFEYRNVESDGETEQTIVFGTYKDGVNKGGLLSKYSKSGDLVWRRTIFSSYNNSGVFNNPQLDATPSFYYVAFQDESFTLAGDPFGYTYGRISSSGNGLGAFEYDDSVGETMTYEVLTVQDKIGRLSDGSVRQDVSDLITYPFNGTKILFDDLATQVANKKRQMDSAGSFEYSGSPAIRPADFQELNLLGGVGITSETVSTSVSSVDISGTTMNNPLWTSTSGLTGTLQISLSGGTTDALTSFVNNAVSGDSVSGSDLWNYSSVTVTLTSSFTEVSTDVWEASSTSSSNPGSDFGLDYYEISTDVVPSAPYPLTLYFPYTASVTTTTWGDQSGKGNSGTVNGATHNAAGYWEFDGVDDDITTGVTHNPSEPFSFTFWFNLDTIKEWHNLVDLFVGGGTDRNFQLFVEGNGDYRIFWGNDSTGSHAITSPSTVASTWYFGAFTCNGSTGTLYRYGNGTLDSVAATIGSGTYATRPLVLGRRGDSSASGFVDGNIGEFQFYKRELTAAQVFQNYNATREKYTGVPASTDPGLTSTRTPA